MSVIISQSHFDTSSTNRFVYRFPSNMKFNKGQTISLQSMSFNNTFYNIESNRNNNQFSIIFNTDSSVKYDFIIPDGYYTITILNDFIHKECKINNLYYIDQNGNTIFLIELRQHPTSNQYILNLLPLPSNEKALQLKYKKPQNATWNFPDVDKTIQFVVSTQSFGLLIGFEDKIYPETIENKKVKFLSSFTPKTTIINNLILTCNLLSSIYYNPINIFTTIPITSKFGNFQSYCCYCPIQNTIIEGYYNTIVIEILDQNFNKITLHDNDILITLSIGGNECM